jgi:hypothetical protein
MSKLNTIGLGVLCAYALLLGVASTGCCGGGGSASAASGDEGSSGGSGSAMTCDDLSSISQCSEHTRKSMKLLGQDFYQGMCELTDGKWSDTACPADGVVGRCDDGEGSVTIYYSTGGSPYDASTARESCEFLDGSFKG